MIINSTNPVTDWTIEDVAGWARKELKFTEKKAQILIEQEIDGAALLACPSLEEAKSYGLPHGAAINLWAAIEKIKKAPSASPTGKYQV